MSKLDWSYHLDIPVHVWPNNDLEEHIFEIWCSCGPRVEEDGDLILHSSFDEREIIEEMFTQGDE